MMRIKILTIVLFLFTYLSVRPSNPGNNNTYPAKSECYIYVSVNKEKKIVIYKLNSERDELLYIGVQNLAGEPGSLCADPCNNKIYAALRDIKSIATLRIDKKSGKTQQIKETPAAENPVYISTDSKGKYLFFTSYSGNMSAVYPIEKSGVNKYAVQVLEAKVNPHMIKSDPSGKYAIPQVKVQEELPFTAFRRMVPYQCLKRTKPENGLYGLWHWYFN